MYEDWLLRSQESVQCHKYTQHAVDKLYAA